MARHLILILVVVGTIGCDRITKHVATTTLAGMPDRSYLGDTVRLGFVENAGGFLGLGADLPPRVRGLIFTVATGLMLAVAAFIALRRRWERWAMVGLTLFVAGGASNWIDRLVRGSVVDFLNVGIGPVRTGIFNVADIAIMVGVGLFIARSGNRPSERLPSND
jgi:signal peptidase II